MKIKFHEKQIAALNALAIDSDIKQVLYGGGVGNFMSLVAHPKYKSCILVV